MQIDIIYYIIEKYVNNRKEQKIKAQINSKKKETKEITENKQMKVNKRM